MPNQDARDRFAAMMAEPDRTGSMRRPDHRVERLIDRMPERWRTTVQWLRSPAARWARIPAGVLFIIGGMLAILPILGLWMIPLGLVMLAEDVPALRRLRDRMLDWSERHWPHWFADDQTAKTANAPGVSRKEGPS